MDKQWWRCVLFFHHSFSKGVFYGLHEVITSQWAFINRLASSYVALPNPFPFQWKLAHTASTKFMFSHLRTTVTKGTLLYDVRTCWWWWWSWHWCRWARWLWWGRWRRGGCILFYVITDSLIYNRILCKNCWTLLSSTTTNWKQYQLKGKVSQKQRARAYRLRREICRFYS